MTTVFTKDSHARATIFVAFAMIYVVWGSTFFFIHRALAGFEPFLLGAVRFSTAGLLLLGWCAFKGYRIFDKSTILHAGLMGLLLLFVDNGIIIWVEQFMPSGLVAIMSASAAIWFVVLDKPNWKTNFRNLPIVAGLFMGFFGVVMLFGDRIAQAFDATERQANIMGMALLLVGALSWTIGSLYSKYFGKPKSGEKRNSTVSTAWQMLIAGAAFTTTAAARGEIANFEPANVPASAWWAISYLVFMGSIVAYSSYIWLLQVRPATEVSTHTYVNPIVAVLLGAWFAHEAVTHSQIIALTVILASVLLINWEAYNLSSLFTRRRKRFTRLREKANIRATIRASIPTRLDGRARDKTKDEF